MRLDALLAAADLPALEGAGSAATEVTAVVQDTRRITPGAVFCCVRGARVDGHDLAGDAVAAGAAALVVDHPVEVEPSVPQVVVPDVRAAVGPLASAALDHPSRSLTVVGVTGTNGKTTTTYLLRSIFEAAGHRADVIGTLSGTAGAPPTTPDAPDLQARLAELRDSGVEAVAMEVSSHGLAMQRVDGTRFAAAVFTNLSQDHLDLHGSMEAYFAAKARLFSPAFTDLAVVDVDEAYGRLLVDAAQVRTVPCSLADAGDVRLAPEGSTFTWRGAELALPLAGRFNVANAVAAATVAAELGIGIDAIREGLAGVGPVRGRFEPVIAGQPFGVVVDYAHTPDALTQLLHAGRELVAAGSGRVLVVFGCGGERDPGKRPRMGAVAADLADRAYLTSDNPRGEDPMAIIAEVAAGIPEGADVVVEPDRATAIARAVADAGQGDLVLLAGKGHETTQTFADRQIPFDDREVARQALLAAGWGGGEDPGA